MEIFLDTGSVKEVEEAYKLGVIDGVTTNPSLIAKEKTDFTSIIKRLSKIVKTGVVNGEVISTDVAGMVKEGKKIAALGKNVIVKIPLIPAGIEAVSKLSKLGIRTNVTLCFSANQAILAAKAGATYISPFIGRIDDIGQDGMELVREIKQIYSNYDYKTKIIVASIRHTRHVIEAAYALYLPLLPRDSLIPFLQLLRQLILILVLHLP